MTSLVGIAERFAKVNKKCGSNPLYIRRHWPVKEGMRKFEKDINLKDEDALHVARFSVKLA